MHGMAAGRKGVSFGERGKRRGRALTFRIQAIHHPLDQLDLVLQAKVDEIGIDQHTIRRTKRSVVTEEETGGLCWYMPHGGCGCCG
jgi:hypothetical protein